MLFIFIPFLSINLMNTFSSKPTDIIPGTCDSLFRFEFDEGYFINSISIRAESFDKAINQFTLILHESSLNYVSFIHKIS